MSPNLEIITYIEEFDLFVFLRFSSWCFGVKIKKTKNSIPMFRSKIALIRPHSDLFCQIEEKLNEKYKSNKRDGPFRRILSKFD